MLFASKIRELRESKQMLQRHISAALDMDNAMYCKIEKGERRAKREQIPLIADILQADSEELLTLWLADQIAEVVAEESVAIEALRVAEEKVKYNKNQQV
ncbi:MAG: helix-turn-helix domain-containing protein [Bacteroidales bacterium]|jgi:transcriptional regulator with XRE-family HTH domain|nr:helix-turn-helix domain-containing protein [Bacteroidales bacterium]